MHCNVWRRAAIPSQKRFHTCEKPVNILSRIIRASSRADDIVLDPFMGSGPVCRKGGGLSGLSAKISISRRQRGGWKSHASS